MTSNVPPVAIAQGDGDPGIFVPAGPCAFCGIPCSDDDFCFGCKVLVCERCDKRPSAADLMAGTHDRSQHGAIERREVMREVQRGRAALKDRRLEEAAAALNSIEALLRP